MTTVLVFLGRNSTDVSFISQELTAAVTEAKQSKVMTGATVKQQIKQQMTRAQLKTITVMEGAQKYVLEGGANL